MPFKPGQQRPANAGRKAGTPNKITRAVREQWLEAFERLGGVDYLVRQGEENPKVFLTGLMRDIPNAIAAKVEHEVRLRIVDRSDTRKDDDGSV